MSRTNRNAGTSVFTNQPGTPNLVLPAARVNDTGTTTRNYPAGYSTIKGKNMDLDAPICLCFNVSRRKILRFIKVEKPRRSSQLSECFGAGTGCGWCRPLLERLNQQHSVLAESPDKFGAKNSNLTQQDSESADSAAPIDQHLDSLDPLQYQADRQAYRDQKRGNPQSTDTHDPLSTADTVEDTQDPAS